MQVNIEEISELIKQKIEGFKLDFDKDETGIVISVGDGIAQIYGLENVRMKFRFMINDSL